MEACPKCNFALAPEAAECPACGIILAKLKAVSGVQRQIQLTPPSLAAPPPLGTPPLGTPLAVAANPYAPPKAPIEGLSVPAPILAAPPAQDLITRPTLEALAAMRPWMRFLAVCGLALNTLTLLASLGLLFWSSDKPELMPIALAYLVGAGVGFVILSPLNRSAAALTRLQLQSASGCLETFAVEQATFWRRMGAVCIAYLLIIVILVALGGVAGTLMGTS
jgi:hypothetical protein